MLTLEDVAPGVQMIRARAGPAKCANSYLVGYDSPVMFEPVLFGNEGADWLDLFVRWSVDGRTASAVALTHEHIDHCREAEGLAAFAGAVFRPDALPGWERIPSPGHAPEHVSFWSPSTGVLVAGDMISSLGPVLMPKNGDLGAYRDSARRLLDLHADLVLPGHGEPMRGRIAREAMLAASERQA